MSQAIYDILKHTDFSKQEYVEETLRSYGFTCNDAGVWTSQDGLVDATVKQCFSDARFYVVLFA